MTLVEHVTISPRDLVLRVASATVGASETPADTNSGPFVEACQKVTGNKKGDPWCASWVARMGVRALGDLWPIEKTGGCQALHDFGLKHGAIDSAPIAGDIFLVWHQELGRFAHTGFVVEVLNDGMCRTYEGNTSGAGSREGWMVAERTRRFKPSDRFLRWTPMVRQ